MNWDIVSMPNTDHSAVALRFPASSFARGPRYWRFNNSYLKDPVFVDKLRVQELCESRRGRPGLSVLMRLTVSVDVKQQ